MAKYRHVHPHQKNWRLQYRTSSEYDLRALAARQGCGDVINKGGFFVIGGFRSEEEAAVAVDKCGAIL